MSHDYNGNAAGISAHDAPVITAHDDADQFSAAVANAPLQQLADMLAFLQTNAALRGALETALFSVAGDTTAVMQLGGAPSTRKLKLQLDGVETHTRFYVLTSGALEITTNAAWSGSQWVRDQAGNASKLAIGFGSFAFYAYPAASASPFSDSAWQSKLQFPTDGRFAFTGTTTGAAGSNPPANTAMANTLVAKNMPKAWATITRDGGTGVITVNDGFNVAGVALVNSDLDVEVTFAQAMGSANYAVLLNHMRTASHAELDLQAIHVNSKAADKMTIRYGNGMTLTSLYFKIDLVVFGAQTT